MDDLKCIEIWERLARINQVQRCGAYGFGRDRGAVWVRVGDGEFGEPWTRSHES